MSLPRPVLAGRFYLITRRCTQRQFLLRPDRETNNAFAYCLIVAAQLYGIDVLSTVAMSNHHHTIIYDRTGRYPEFIEHFHKLLARCLNVHHRRRENFWSSQQTSVVHLVGSEDVINKLVYVAMNPVKADLVDQAFQWPGVNGFKLLRSGRALTAVRPWFFFRKEEKDGDARKGRKVHQTPERLMPESVSLELTIPSELGMSRDEVIATVDRLVEEGEDAARKKRRSSGITVMGIRRVCDQAPSDCPKSWIAHGRLRPRLAARNREARFEALARIKQFLDAYRKARSAMLLGVSAPFPPGTYWLRRFASVPIGSVTPS
jgi:putative transposase